MLKSAFQLGEENRLKTVPYKLNQNLWIRYDLAAIDLSFANWTTIKYLNDAGDDFSDEINLVPKNVGGLYMFSIKCPILPGLSDFPAYIGRAQLTQGQNLRKRCKEYRNKFARDDERPKITTLFNYWARELFLSFIPIAENDAIIDYEKKLINCLLLPFNDEIPDTEIRQSVLAFNL